MRAINFWAICAVLLSGSTALQAAPITIPTMLNSGDSYRLAFVTQDRRDATSMNIGDYNDFVTMAAEAVPELNVLGTTWAAIASTSAVNARTNTSTNLTPGGNTGVPIFLLNDTILANNYEDLWDSTIDNAFEINELGEEGAGSSAIWTGTRDSGSQGASQTWLGGAAPFLGLPGDTDDDWIQAGNGSSNGQNRSFYAISGILDVPGETAAVPEPSSLALLATGGAALIGCYRRRKVRSL